MASSSPGFDWECGVCSAPSKGHHIVLINQYPRWLITINTSIFCPYWEVYGGTFVTPRQRSVQKLPSRVQNGGCQSYHLGLDSKILHLTVQCTIVLVQRIFPPILCQGEGGGTNNDKDNLAPLDQQ
jgi:hypothetical protein